MYEISPAGGIHRTSDNAYIPIDFENRDYLDFLAWQDAGGILDTPLITPSPVPTTCTRKQGLLALLAAGKLDTIDTIVAQAPRAVQIAFNNAQDFERADQALQFLANEAGMSSADLDDLFSAAVKL